VCPSPGINADPVKTVSTHFTLTAHGSQEKLAFNSLGDCCDYYLTTDADRNGNTVTYAYGSTSPHLPQRVTDSQGRVITSSPDGLGRISTITDSTSRQVGFTYNTSGQPAVAQSRYVDATRTRTRCRDLTVT
jgi:uncharacterized protein RhaS with RHS repeats